MILGSRKPKSGSVTCNSLKLQGQLTSGIYPLQGENESPRLGFCDMTLNGYLEVNLETSIGYQIEAFPDPGRVMFGAVRTSGKSNSGQVITYDTTTVNTFDVLDKESGQFKAPISGTYVFSFSGFSYDDTFNVAVEVLKNNQFNFRILKSNPSSGAQVEFKAEAKA